jgi:hypothetical protein
MRKPAITMLRISSLLLVAFPAAAAAQSHGIHVRAWIDGRSRLVLDGATARWEHLDFAAPGRLDCNVGAEVQPTFIDGDVWFPQWPDVPDCENRDCGCSSSLFTRLNQAVPEAEIFPELEVMQGRGVCLMVEWPVAENGYRIVVEFDDNAWNGADWYEIDLALPGCGVQRYCPATSNSTGVAGYLDIAGSLSVSVNDTALTANHCPPGSLGLFLGGQDKAQIPFANGTLCVDPAGHGPLIVAPAVQVSRAGQAEIALQPDWMPARGRLADHATWSFQFWFRDPLAGGARANLTNALRVTFCP